MSDPPTPSTEPAIPGQVDLAAGEAPSGGVGIAIDDDGQPVVANDDLHHSITGARVDPVDGQPMFGEWEGVMMSRERYLEARREKARTDLVERLRNSNPQDDEA